MLQRTQSRKLTRPAAYAAYGLVGAAGWLATTFPVDCVLTATSVVSLHVAVQVFLHAGQP